MKTENKKEIEKGKAIVQLAQIIMILAGFLFATGGIAYTNTTSTLSTSLPLIITQSLELSKINRLDITTKEKKIFDTNLNATQKYLETINLQLNLAKRCFIVGGFFVLVSFITWGLGYNKL